MSAIVPYRDRGNHQFTLVVLIMDQCFERQQATYLYDKRQAFDTIFQTKVHNKGDFNMSVKKLSLAGILVAMGVVCSTFYIPIGVSKVFPIQHFINVVAGVVLGPAYAVGMAFTTSLLRNIMGTGSLLAFPGSMCGALLSGLLYKYIKKLGAAFLGEVIGTGILGALLAYPIAVQFLSSKAAFYGFIIPFGISSLSGALISMVLLISLSKVGILQKVISGEV